MTLAKPFGRRRLRPSFHKAPRLLTRAFGARRLGTVMALAVGIGYPLDLLVNSGRLGVTYRAIELGLAGLLAYGVFEHWPQRLPRVLARWALQVFAVGAVMPPSNLLLTLLDHPHGAPPLWSSAEQLGEFGVSTALAMLIAPWTALAALIRQKDAMVRDQALAFAFERSEFERESLNARLHLLQAQVTPHFLFNTLANVKALVVARSPQAPAVLDSLIAYFRATVPNLNDTMATIDQELVLVRSYLELMHMRMPDRLEYHLEVDPTASELPCPPMTLLTLVENAVKHGIDPSELGGRIDIDIRRLDDRCVVRVADTGVGLRPMQENGLGTGLATLRQRLLLAFGAEAHLVLSEQTQGGVLAELAYPAVPGAGS